MVLAELNMTERQTIITFNVRSYLEDFQQAVQFLNVAQRCETNPVELKKVENALTGKPFLI